MRVLFVVIAITAGLVVVALGSAGETAIPAGNLVKNPGAEANAGGDHYVKNVAPNGWTKGEGETRPIQVIRYAEHPHLPNRAVSTAIGGGRNFFGGGYPSTVSSAFQMIDVSGATPEIDSGGLRACLSAFLGGAKAYEARARVTVEFLDEGEVRVGQMQAGPVTQGNRQNTTTLLRRTAQLGVPRNTRQLRVTITSESGGRTSNYSSVDNISVSLTRGTCEPVLAVRCAGGALVASVTPSDIGRTQRVRFEIRGAKGSKQVNDTRAPFSATVPMTGLSGRLTVTATVTQTGSGPIVLSKKSRRC
jgi:hypothetical protein